MYYFSSAFLPHKNPLFNALSSYYNNTSTLVAFFDDQPQQTPYVRTDPCIRVNRPTGRMSKSSSDRAGKRAGASGWCGVTACKYLLCVYNFIFLLSGCVVCGVGVWTVLEKGLFIKLLTVLTYEVTSWLMVCTGGVAVLTALLGYTAIGLENKCLLALYTILLVLVFMFESITGLLAYVYQEQIDQDLNDHLFESFIQGYGGDKEVTQSVDAIQRQFACCGSDSFADWRKSNWSGEHPGFRVPDSCCKTESPGCGVRDHPSNIPYTGCIHTFSAQLTDHLVLLGVVSLALALLQIFGVIFTACLFSRLSRQEKYTSVRTNSSSQDTRHGYWTAT